MRTVICHYHIFKNSGSSFDALLQRNYGERHICFDGPFPFFTIDQVQLARIIERKPDVVAFSSHQITLPAPASPDCRVLPAVFIRHPLLRAQSIYRFKKQSRDGTVTADNAREMSFARWVSCCLDHPTEITHISNMQTRMLGAEYREPPKGKRIDGAMVYDYGQALENLDSVELLARTEFYAGDVSRFPALLERFGMDFTYADMKPVNATSDTLSLPLEERVALLREEMPEKTFNRLAGANEQDMALFEAAGRLIEEDR